MNNSKFSALKWVALAAMFGLVACGSSRSDRAISGAGIGAGVGAVGGMIMGTDPVAGAVLGGAVGAGTGALTSKDKIDLGNPAWK